MGAQLAGKNVVVGFDGSPAQILFDSDTQINVVVPAVLGNKSSSQMVVVVDGTSSLTQTVPLAGFGPGIFKGGVLNQDGSSNGPEHPSQLARVLQIFATGLSGNGQITVRINGAVIDSLDFGGPAPGLAGVQQVNVRLPAGLTGASAEVSVCGGIPGKPDQAVCSPAVQVAIAQ
jgi:uncharacterized protein (TIGR03437 family)